VAELLKGFLPAEWMGRLDLTTLERVGNSFVSDDLRERHGDLIWRLRFRGERESWFYLYLLLEFQSTSDPFMAVRLLTYVGLLLEEIIRREKLKPEDRLPAVLPLVLHNGKRPWRAPRDLGSLFSDVPKELRRYLPRLRYLLLDEARLDLDRPELADNPIAALFRIEASRASGDFAVLTRKLASLLAGEQDPEFRRTLNDWLISLVRRTFPGAILSETMDLMEAPMLEETAQEWRRQAIREGQVSGMREMLLQLMTARFGRLPAGIRLKVEEISSKQDLRKLARKALTAKSLQQLGL
jgi:predicted transposase YdaD